MIQSLVISFPDSDMDVWSLDVFDVCDSVSLQL